MARVCKVFTVFDSKMQTYYDSFLSENKMTALRSMSQSMSNPKSPFGLYPADFTLFEIGEWDDQKGLYTMYDHKINLGCLIELKALERDNGGLREVGDAP